MAWSSGSRYEHLGRLRSLGVRTFAVVTVAAVAVFSRSSVAGEPVVDWERLAAHVAAGEFGPARQIAAQAEDPHQRDVALQRIASAQAEMGLRSASLSTAADIANDQIRGEAFGTIGHQPLGSGAARGGAAMADFQTLIDLITSTVAPDSWDAVGGPGAAEPFPGGVFVDASGLMRRRPREATAGELDAVREAARRSSGKQDVRRASLLRKVSLTRLEREAHRLWAMGKRPEETMRTMAGLQRVRYVFVYPETRDVVLAGPAGAWTADGEGRLVSVDTGRPVLRLDDFVVVLRNAMSPQQGQFGCSITPRQENLASVQAFLRRSAERPLKPYQREAWLEELRSLLGRQDISVFGIEARSRAAGVLVEADYHMKLVGLGIEDGTLGVESYLDSVKPAADGAAPALDVLRWWFTLNYDALRTTASRNAFEIRGSGARVLSENEMLNERGRRVPTGRSDEQNSLFARSFTEHFPALAAKYRVYAEMQNIFDLAIVAALVREENLTDPLGWHLTFFGDDGKYEGEQGIAPQQVESVIRHRIVDRTHILVGVSGGVAVDTRPFVLPSRITTDEYGLLKAERAASLPRELPRDAWWWD